ncbi:MAG: polysaccharide pyruvyl transferase family protein [Hungatella hathewayi]|uniref:polysaccharide pyruvyl transferase family protein n=1 Tax=Hungatella TaxID=1649459 RepID=UPI001105924D|nr:MULTISPECIES: polysaccharide pyruvyl transferase family protein [Hungatella]MCI7380913.1 polysaccharide pyruvyl transferase family protein [Hungatella sp.]MDY6236075.1 polysaccharide pyruvyl transferase family protein [Hungatella hathewayi]
MKIGLLGEYYSKNLGEPLLFSCTEYLCRKEGASDLQIKNIDIFGRTFSGDDSVWYYFDKNPIVLGLKVIRKLAKIFGVINTLWLDEYIWQMGTARKNLIKSFRDQMQGLDGIIVMGAGSIKYDVRLNFAPYYMAFMTTASELGIPVFINCAGIESKYNQKDRRCRQFCKVLSMDILKIATTRDDLNTLKQMIHNPHTEVARIADIGVWSAETFNISKKETNIIGLGIITPIRFAEFKRRITPQQYEEEMLKIINTLEKQNKKWKLFNNGDVCDSEYAKELCEKAGINPSDKLLTPKTPKELVEIISGFQGIITSRLHSCIVSYSLGIPFVAISWNNKLKYFADNIGVSERVMDSDELNFSRVLEKFELAVSQGYCDINKEKYRQTSIVYIKKYLTAIEEEMNGRRQ